MIDGLKDGGLIHEVLRGSRWGASPPRPPTRGAPPTWTPRSMAWVRPVWGLCADLLEKCTFFDDLSIGALKLAANHEKQVFTFFGFLPPYIGVSGLLVYCKR